MSSYSKEFKAEAIRLSDEIGVKKAAAQLGMRYAMFEALKSQGISPKRIEMFHSNTPQKTAGQGRKRAFGSLPPKCSKTLIKQRKTRVRYEPSFGSE